jgi:hypothetical protein
MLSDPTECRQRALHCAKLATECRSAVARERFFDLAKTWMRLAVQLEEQWALLDEWGDRKSLRTQL